MKKLLIALILSLSVLTAFATEHTARPRVQVITMDKSLAKYNLFWQKEIERRFPSAIAIFCHGGSIQEGEWIVRVPFGDSMVMKASDLVKHYQVLYPSRTIVLVACNPGHLKLGVPGVYYANSNIFCVPDRSLVGNEEYQYFKMDGTEVEHEGNRSDREPDCVGNIWEFSRDEDKE